MHASSVISCAYSPDGAQLLTCSSDKTAKIFDVASATCVATFTFGTSVGYMQATGSSCPRAGLCFFLSFFLALSLVAPLFVSSPSSPPPSPSPPCRRRRRRFESRLGSAPSIGLARAKNRRRSAAVRGLACSASSLSVAASPSPFIDDLLFRARAARSLWLPLPFLVPRRTRWSGAASS